MTYCDYLQTIDGEKLALHRDYHDNHYGFPVKDDNELFERLMFEINQAGLNWLLILKKQQSFRNAFNKYDIDKVAAYKEEDINRLMSDNGIIRNRLKINAAIENAKAIQHIRKDYGSFKNWLEIKSLETNTIEDWTKIFKKTFKFTGGEIVNEFLVSTGYLSGAHSQDCPVYKKIIKIRTDNEKSR